MPDLGLAVKHRELKDSLGCSSGQGLAASGSLLPQSGKNYAVKSSYLLSFLESVPAVGNRFYRTYQAVTGRADARLRPVLLPRGSPAPPGRH